LGIVRSAVIAGATVLALGMVLGGCSAPVTAPPTAPSSAVPTPTPTIAPVTYTRVWSDDFSGPAGAVADPATWTADTGGNGWGNRELQYYTPGNANASLDGHGSLALVAKVAPAARSCWYGRCAYTSARLKTEDKFSVQYGRIEARIKLPAGSGVWPAFWMLGADIKTDPWPGAGEIDVMENVGKEPGTVHGSLHGPGYSGGNDPTATYTLRGDQPLSANFHTFAIDWTPTSIEWLVDGNVYERQTPEDVLGHPWEFNKPFFLLLNLAVGGTFPGNPTSGEAFPATMLVDYVAVYKQATPQ
jgi:beta-glucanase (GH16 family)